MTISKEDMAKILEALAGAYEEAGKKLETATLVSDITEDGVEGEILIDNREDEELN